MPFEGGTGLELARTGLEMLRGTADKNGPLFQNFLPALVRDMSWEAKLPEEDIEDQVWQQLMDQGCFSSKGA